MSETPLILWVRRDLRLADQPMLASAVASGRPLLPVFVLDPETEARVYQRLFAHFPDAALVSSVHRLHLLDRFDEVILMRAGRIEAVGRAWELAQGSALFRELLAAQAVSGGAPGA